MKLTEKIKVYAIAVISILIRLIAMPYAQVVDADATSRIFAAERWLSSPTLITEGVWPPLHYYFNALAIWIFGEHVTGPIIFHILLAGFTAVPLFYFTKREFSEKGAWFTIIFYLLCPVVFRNSFHALSGIPHAFLIAMAINFLSKSIRSNDLKYAVYSGLFMTIASGFRYEAWLLIALLTGMSLLFKKIKITVAFWLSSMIFPMFWMIGNYVAHGDILYGLSGAYHWNVVMEGVNDSVNKVDLIKRLMFFPFSWFFLFSPALVIWLGIVLWKKVKQKILIQSRLIWAIPFWVFLIVFIYKAFEGTLLLQHRFSLSLILFSAPFVSILFEEFQWTNTKKILVGFLFCSLLPMSYYWMYVPFEKAFVFSYSLKTAFGETRSSSMQSFPAIPRLSDQYYAQLENKINENLTSKNGLVLDFVSWESTFYLALNSNLHPDNIFIVDGAKHGGVYKENLKKVLSNHPEGIIMLKCFSKFSEIYSSQGNTIVLDLGEPVILELEPLDAQIGIGTYQYKITNTRSTNSEILLVCPQKGSKDYYKFEIKENTTWYNDIKRKAIEKGISTEEMLDLDAQWLVDQDDKK